MAKVEGVGTLVFIGCGAMGEAILKGLLAAKLATENDIVAAVPTEKRQSYLQKTYGIKATGDNVAAVKNAELVVLAVKPQMAKTAITKEVAEAIPAACTVVSIMGSVDLEMIHALVPNRPAIRVMPNTPLAVGEGMTALTPDEQVSDAALETVKKIFASCGQVEVVAESAMEAITAISGCGPGYCFVLIDALADAGVKAGLPRALAIKLAAQTFMGSGKMAVETGMHPAQLRDQVTSPGGTTIAGIHALEEHAVRAAMYDAVEAVLARSEELKGKKDGR